MHVYLKGVGASGYVLEAGDWKRTPWAVRKPPFHVKQRPWSLEHVVLAAHAGYPHPTWLAWQNRG